MDAILFISSGVPPTYHAQKPKSLTNRHFVLLMTIFFVRAGALLAWSKSLTGNNVETATLRTGAQILLIAARRALIYQTHHSEMAPPLFTIWNSSLHPPILTSTRPGFSGSPNDIEGRKRLSLMSSPSAIPSISPLHLFQKLTRSPRRSAGNEMDVQPYVAFTGNRDIGGTGKNSCVLAPSLGNGGLTPPMALGVPLRGLLAEKAV